MHLPGATYHFFGLKTDKWMYLFLGVLMVVTAVIYLNFPSGYNQGIYHYQGLVLKNGGLPYTGFIEKKGPMGLLTYGLASLLFGESAMAYRLFDLIILGVTGTFLFRLTKLFYSTLTAWLVSTIWFSHILIDGPGNTADVTNIITAVYVILAFHLLSPKRKNYFWVAGLLIGVACWVKPTAIIIAFPILLFLFHKRFATAEKFTFHKFGQIVFGLLIPTIIFTMYLLLSGTFKGFWEAVVLDPLLNYADDVSRFSLRTFVKTGKAFLHDPFLRIVGLFGLFLVKGNKDMRLLQLSVIGIALMLFIEGRFYPYHFSIFWPFLTLGLVHVLVVFSQNLTAIKQKLVLVFSCLILSIPSITIGAKFLNAGGLTPAYYAGEMFLFPDFKEMYDFRQPVVTYLSKQLKPGDEIFVLGRDPNIYLELGAITSCRLAREGHLLVGNNAIKLPDYLVGWQHEMVEYMLAEKAEWIIVRKELCGNWSEVFAADMDVILTKKYQLKHETIGHFIYQKAQHYGEI